MSRILLVVLVVLFAAGQVTIPASAHEGNDDQWVDWGACQTYSDYVQPLHITVIFLQCPGLQASPGPGLGPGDGPIMEWDYSPVNGSLRIRGCLPGTPCLESLPLRPGARSEPLLTDHAAFLPLTWQGATSTVVRCSAEMYEVRQGLINILIECEPGMPPVDHFRLPDSFEVGEDGTFIMSGVLPWSRLQH